MANFGDSRIFLHEIGNGIKVTEGGRHKQGDFLVLF